jgi:hypothetical protein
MGLDMHVYKTKEDIGDVGKKRPDDTIEVMYWRKHPNMHGWFERLWLERGGVEDVNDVFGGFNGGDWVHVKLEDLDRLEKDIISNSLPHTTGFFFGASYHDEDEIKADLEFVKKARAELQNGYKLFYTSSW